MARGRFSFINGWILPANTRHPGKTGPYSRRFAVFLGVNRGKTRPLRRVLRPNDAVLAAPRRVPAPRCTKRAERIGNAGEIPGFAAPFLLSVRKSRSVRGSGRSAGRGNGPGCRGTGQEAPASGPPAVQWAAYRRAGCRARRGSPAPLPFRTPRGGIGGRCARPAPGLRRPPTAAFCAPGRLPATRLRAGPAGQRSLA